MRSVLTLYSRDSGRSNPKYAITIAAVKIYINMAKVNNSRLIEIIAVKTNIYMPIVEAIANSIDAIEERKGKDGEITIELIRNPQLLKADDEGVAPVTSVKITDNGIGFTEGNLKSFDKLFSEKKIKIGGKGFGRLTYLKYFTSTKITSTFYDSKSQKWKRRTFAFLDGEEFIAEPKLEDAEEEHNKTVVELTNLRDAHRNKLNKKLDTIARKLFETLLPYFVTDGYNPPKITITDPTEPDDPIVLNRYLADQDRIQLLHKEKTEIEGIEKQQFQVKIFKIYHSTNRSSVALTANHRLVTSTPMHTYDPEFYDEFSDKSDSSDTVSGNYIVKAYVIGDYLDTHVSTERGGFLFADDDETAMFPLSKKTIEKAVTGLTARKFQKELEPRKEKKIDRVKSYIDDNAPWNKSLLKDLDYNSIPYNATGREIDTAVNKIAYDKEQAVRSDIHKLLASNNADELDKRVAEIAQSVTELGQGKLAHYVSLRRAILDVFEKSLQLKDTNRYELENIVHKIIFPLKKDTDTISYDSHNLWLLDERLSFTEHVASDKPLNKGDERPDLLSFDRPIAVREGNELSNPITIFEFKRPGRDQYSDSDNPLTQVAKYVEKIRTGNYTNPNGRPVHADENTPAYCFVICDLVPRIKEFCNLYGLTLSPDKQSYYGFHPNFRIYFEVISFEKVLKDSQQRNKVFFRKLGID
jgi:hypothetical protein